MSGFEPPSSFQIQDLIIFIIIVFRFRTSRFQTGHSVSEAAFSDPWAYEGVTCLQLHCKGPQPLNPYPKGPST